MGAHTKAGRHERGRNVPEPQVMVCDEGSGQERDLSEVQRRRKMKAGQTWGSLECCAKQPRL